MKHNSYLKDEIYTIATSYHIQSIRIDNIICFYCKIPCGSYIKNKINTIDDLS